MGLRVNICLVAVAVIVFISISEVHSGVVTNQSVSVSSSVTSNKSKNPDAATKKSTRVGKVLYTAPYSHVRVTKHEGKFFSAGASPRFRSITGPVLVRNQEVSSSTTAIPSTTTTTTTTEQTTTSTSPEPIVIDVVTIEEIEGSSAESTTANFDV